MPESLLVEILTEELPPKSLRALSDAFTKRLCDEMTKFQLTDAKGVKSFATPRRLAVLVPGVAAKGEDRESEVTGPTAIAPAQAIDGFAR
jgi:glycyl-tRNA synthetase beta chain